MSTNPDYFSAFSRAKLRREDGIIEVTLHTDGGPLQWKTAAHREYERLFHAIAKDRDNRVVILTGCGPDFSGPEASTVGSNHLGKRTFDEWDEFRSGGKDLLMNLLDIEVPIVAAVNGPARRHAEIPLLSDIVLASETALFQDSAHFVNDVVPGDGMHVIMPLLLGLNRGRHFLYTGREIHAHEAHALGLVAEVLPQDQVLERAWAVARELAKHRDVVLKNTRLAVTQLLKIQLLDVLEYGLNLEALAAISAQESELR
ncbi:enoyl-CoA hydratase/isomerase family protein [Amycolatopsis pithecellobii]|uniref:Enoyl-CoA hydratase/isomerase family protein n=1 Tax=Amycolatopsis pithecellobii TaxID=664692 RepID=A0A6N7Z017_9PSEU|nr:enoyl-CoA hydratase/isomerase family protein [Amycolatopsis pithecellobii]MTD52880.1 enoyl-CoA hydratase/isomerase family protein [Amycolatopsis pithecellobii]